MKTTPITAVVLSLALGAFTAVGGPVTVTNVTAVQRPADPIVDISYDLLNPSGGVHTVSLCVSKTSGATYLLSSTNFSGAVGAGVTTGANKQVVWFAAGDLAATITTNARVRVIATDGAGEYCIIDVSGGPNASHYPAVYQGEPPPINDEHKTSKIVLRKIPAGSFVMGSPTNEFGRISWCETQHNVTLTKAFYIGIYEITQAQYLNVVGNNPSYFSQGAHAPKRPVEQVSWNMVRGGTWPTGTLAGTSFIGKLRSKTGLAFDLPTEAQWEYACRAGTTKALNNNMNLTDYMNDGNVNLLGRNIYNGGNLAQPPSNDYVNGAHATVGSYLANQWGLYDMHGNVWEWCLDWYADNFDAVVTNPPGPASGSANVMRGGAWFNVAYACRSAIRSFSYSDYTQEWDGFRLALPADE